MCKQLCKKNGSMLGGALRRSGNKSLFIWIFMHLWNPINTWQIEFVLIWIYPDSTHTLGQRWQIVVWLDQRWRWQHDVGPTLGQRYKSDNYFSLSGPIFLLLGQCWANVYKYNYNFTMLAQRWRNVGATLAQRWNIKYNLLLLRWFVLLFSYKNTFLLLCGCIIIKYN